MAKSMKPGGGGRFAKLAAKIGPGAAATAGREKHGKEQMAKWAAEGRKRASGKRKSSSNPRKKRKA